MKPYRSRRKGRYTLLVILLSLILLLLVTVLLFFVAQEYFVFTAQGFRFVLPSMYRDEVQASMEDSLPLNLEIESPIDFPGETDAEEEAVSEPEPEAPAEPVYTNAQLMAVTELIAFAAQGEGGPDTGCAVPVKDTDGAWKIPGGGEESAEKEALAQGVTALAAKGISCTAIAAVMRDETGPRGDRASALKTYNNVLWLDRDYIPWFDPYAPGTEEYIKRLVSACGDAGFEEVLLTDFTFVTRGLVNLVNFGSEDSPENRMLRIAHLAEQAAAALHQAGEDCRLSVLLTPTAAANLSDGEAGQDVALLAQFCDVLYVATDDPGLDVSALESAIEGTGCRIGLYLATDQLPLRICDVIWTP